MSRPLTQEEADGLFLHGHPTEAERSAVEQILEHGSGRKAADAVGRSRAGINEAIARLRKRAAIGGYANGHWEAGTAHGYRMGKVTVQRGPAGVERTWERQHPDAINLDAMIARCEKILQDFPRFAPIPAPAYTPAPLTNFLGLFDLHIGERISSDDPLSQWDIPIAVRVTRAAIENALASAPIAKRIVVCFGGDAAHYDGLKPVTPRSRHVLHADGDFDDMVDAVLGLATYAVDRALETHEEVYLIWAEGNHDEAGSVWMRRLLERLYENNPRLTVVQSKTPYYALRFGKVMICVHHGHGSKLTELAGKFAAMFREMWGQATYAYCHAGHRHHIEAKEKDGMVAIQHPTLAPSDDYALSKGLISRRGCMMITYHDEYGEANSVTTRPEMLGVL